MNKLYCHNCGQAKDFSRLSVLYCESCATASDQAAEHATREGLDPGAARREALLGRAPHPMDNKLMPNGVFNRIDTRAFEERLNIKPGDVNDPRRGTGR